MIKKRPAPTDPVLLCSSQELLNGGKGVRFNVLEAGSPIGAFVVRFNNTPYAFVNRCAHVPVELDWSEGDYFESSGLYLMCAMHGAIYEPQSGRCVGGPCRGASLRALVVMEEGNQVFWQPDQVYQPVVR